jgi:hypothetical protein
MIPPHQAAGLVNPLEREGFFVRSPRIDNSANKTYTQFNKGGKQWTHQLSTCAR